MSDEIRLIVSVTSRSRENDPANSDPRVFVARDYHLTMNWPNGAWDTREAVGVALDAAERTGMLHEGVHTVDIRVEWDGML